MAEVRIVRPGLKRLRPWTVASVLVAALLAYLLVGYLRGPDPFRRQLEVASEGDLARILSSLSSESQSLEEELSALKVELANLQNASASQDVKAEEASSQLNALLVLAGTTKVNGPGIEIIIEDPLKHVTFDSLLGTVEELRDAGAEAIAINDHRFGNRSALSTANSVILMDNVPLVAPFRIRAIGPATALEGGLKIPGGSLDTLKAENGVAVDVHQVEEIALPPISNPPSFRAAIPVKP